MPTYQYIAKTPEGKEINGLMQADNEAAVVRTLDDRELFPVSVNPHAEAKAVRGRGRRVRIRDLAVMYGQLADLLRAGVPMLRALSTLSKALQNATLRRILVTIGEDVAAGQSESHARGHRLPHVPQVPRALPDDLRRGVRLHVLHHLQEGLRRGTGREGEGQQLIVQP